MPQNVSAAVAFTALVGGVVMSIAGRVVLLVLLREGKLEECLGSRRSRRWPTVMVRERGGKTANTQVR